MDWCRWAVDIRGSDLVGLEIGVGALTGGFAEGNRASSRKRRYAQCIIAEHGRGHPATEDEPAGRVSRVGKFVGQARQIRKIDWCHWAVDVHSVDAVGLEVDVGTSGRLRAVLPKGMAQENADTDRLRKVMQICRGC